MGAREDIARERANLDAVEAVLDALPLSVPVKFADSCGIVMGKFTYDEFKIRLGAIQKAMSLDFKGYRYNPHCEHLTVTYNSLQRPGVNIEFWMTDVENSLSRLGNGKCQLIRRVKPSETETVLVCNLSGGDAS